MARRGCLAALGMGATTWSALRADTLFRPGSPLELGTAALPPVIQAFFAVAIFAGLVGGVALSLDRPWAANLLWFSWLGVLIEGNWGPGLLHVRLDLGVTELLLTSAFAVVAQWNRKTGPRKRS